MSSEQAPKLGQLITGPAFRDAVHIAVAPVVSDNEGDMEAGDHVLINSKGRAVQCFSFHKWAVGVVDPFLRHPVKHGETFWLFMYPNTVQGLRHSWTHSAFKTRVPTTPTTPKEQHDG